MQPYPLSTLGARLMGWSWGNKLHIKFVALSTALHGGTKGKNVRGMRLCVY